MTDRFAALVIDWGLGGGEVDALLAVPVGVGARIAAARLTPGIDAETRMRRSLEIDGLACAILGGRDRCGEWLRAPNPGIVGGLAPLSVLCDRGDGLRAVRDVLREEAAQARSGTAS